MKWLQENKTIIIGNLVEFQRSVLLKYLQDSSLEILKFHVYIWILFFIRHLLIMLDDSRKWCIILVFDVYPTVQVSFQLYWRYVCNLPLCKSTEIQWIVIFENQNWIPISAHRSWGKSVYWFLKNITVIFIFIYEN